MQIYVENRIIALQKMRFMHAEVRSHRTVRFKKMFRGEHMMICLELGVIYLKLSTLQLHTSKPRVLFVFTQANHANGKRQST